MPISQFPAGCPKRHSEKNLMNMTQKIFGDRVIIRYAVMALLSLILLTIAHTVFGDEKSAYHADRIPATVVETLAAGDINGAIIAMRDEKGSLKLMYLMHSVTRINDALTGPKPKRADAHEAYQNVAISYHNLYLFLKARGIEQQEYAKQAHNYYRKARSAGTILHKADCDVLDAALIAASGDRAKAEKQFSKIDELSMRGDYESAEYLAAYYSAVGNAPMAIKNLEAAYRMKPEAIVAWLAIGDDFTNIADDPQFEELLVSWKTAEAERRLSLSVPKASKPKLDVKDETGLFRPQKSMPHYDLKKNKSISKKKAAPKNTKAASKKGKSAKKKEFQKSKVTPKNKSAKPAPKKSTKT